MLKPVQYNSNKYTGVNLFMSCFVGKIKGKVTDKLYKKSRFIEQGYNY